MAFILGFNTSPERQRRSVPSLALRAGVTGEECFMPDLPFDRQRAALVALWRLIEERRHGEDDLTFSAAQAEEAVVAKGEQTRKTLENNHERELAERDAGFHMEIDLLSDSQKAEELAGQRAFAEQ